MTVKPKNKSHWDKNNPAEVARDKLRKEIKKGTILRPDRCEICGGFGQTFGHHYKGYAFPLDVWFVCVSCNTRLTVHDGSQSKENAIAEMAKNKASKTDNHNPKVKLDLRRYFLNKYHVHEPPKVFDCCQGGGVMWSTLQKEFAVANYWGVDLKPKKGRLKIDSVRILQQGISEDIIDVDTYGEPWKHWLALLPHIKKPLTVFLTLATIKMGGGGNITNESKAMLGLDKLPSIPQSFCGKLSALVPDLMLANAKQFATITEAVEAVSTGNARYIGVRLEPINKNGLPTVDAACKPKQAKL